MAGWTIGEVGTSEGPSGSDRHKPDGQIDIPFGPATTGNGYTSNLSERSDVPYEHDFHKMADISGAPGRVDVPDPALAGAIPDPGCGQTGTPIDLGSVAPDTDGGLSPDLDGSGAPGASSFALGRVPE